MASLDYRALVETLLEYLRDHTHVKPWPVVEVPPAKKKKDRSACEHVLLVGDVQAGLRTPSFDRHVIRERFARLATKVLATKRDQECAFPINKITVVCLGDFVHHDRIGKNVNWAELEAHVRSQAFDIAGPALSNLMQTLAANYNEVEEYEVPGNHGIGGRDDHYDHNWDLITYDVARAFTHGQPNITWHPNDDFCARFDVLGVRFFAWHGHQVTMNGLVPAYGIQRDVSKWVTEKSEGPFDVSLLGHFHTAHDWEANGTRIIINGTFLSDDRYTRERIKQAPSISQTLLTVHPKRGILSSRQIGTVS